MSIQLSLFLHLPQSSCSDLHWYQSMYIPFLYQSAVSHSISIGMNTTIDECTHTECLTCRALAIIIIT